MSDFLTSLASALDDRYRIERELGRGGMGVVFLAEDLKHSRKVDWSSIFFAKDYRLLHAEMRNRLATSTRDCAWSGSPKTTYFFPACAALSTMACTPAWCAQWAQQ